MSLEDNGNIITSIKPTSSSSNEDLSEYTDADESISAPTEFLAEFLSAVMLKDYVTALKYCKLILQYEPNNATAKEFYPLIVEKLKQNISSCNGNADEENSNESEDEESEEGNISSSHSESSDSSASEESISEEGQECAEEEEEIEQCGDKVSKGSSEGDGTTGSYSSLEDDEAETDQLRALIAKYQTDNMNLGNGNKIYAPTAHHVPANINEKMDSASVNNDQLNLQNKIHFMISSDSESPTEPCQTVAMLRAKIVPNINV